MAFPEEYFGKQIKYAFLWVWLITSLLIFMVLLLPFVFEPDTVYKIAPDCQSMKLQNKKCVLCGMTRSFVLISQGEVSQARKVARYSLWLYAVLALNELVVIFLGLYVILVRTLRWNANTAS